MTVINKTTNASYNFVAPEIAADSDSKVEVAFPTAEAKTETPGATLTVAVNRTTTVVDLGTLSAAMTLTLAISADVQVGALLHLKAKSDGTARDITLSTGFTAPVLSGTQSKTKVQSFIYNGSSFLPLGAALQID